MSGGAAAPWMAEAGAWWEGPLPAALPGQSGTEGTGVALPGQTSRPGRWHSQRTPGLLPAHWLAAVSAAGPATRQTSPVSPGAAGDSTGCPSAPARHRCTCVPKPRQVSLPRCISWHGLCQKHESVSMGWTPGGQRGRGGEGAHGDSHRGTHTPCSSVTRSGLEPTCGLENHSLAKPTSACTQGGARLQDGSQHSHEPTELPHRSQPSTGGGRGHVYEEHRG